MLVRKQLLIPNWLEDYVKDKAKASKQSEGEIFRALACLGLNYLFSLVGRDINMDISQRATNLANHVKDGSAPEEEEIRLFLDDLYFETRKMTEEYLSDAK